MFSFFELLQTNEPSALSITKQVNWYSPSFVQKRKYTKKRTSRSMARSGKEKLENPLEGEYELFGSALQGLRKSLRNSRKYVVRHLAEFDRELHSSWEKRESIEAPNSIEELIKHLESMKSSLKGFETITNHELKVLDHRIQYFKVQKVQSKLKTPINAWDPRSVSDYHYGVTQINNNNNNNMTNNITSNINPTFIPRTPSTLVYPRSPSIDTHGGLKQGNTNTSTHAFTFSPYVQVMTKKQVQMPVLHSTSINQREKKNDDDDNNNIDIDDSGQKTWLSLDEMSPMSTSTGIVGNNNNNNNYSYTYPPSPINVLSSSPTTTSPLLNMNDRLKYRQIYQRSNPDLFKRKWERIFMDRVIIDYMLRNYCFDSAKNLLICNELGLLTTFDIFHHNKNTFIALQQRNLHSLFKWCRQNKSHLKQHQSQLEYWLHCVHIIDLAKKGKESEALQYIRNHLLKDDNNNDNTLNQKYSNISQLMTV
ncbi:hypothetical protein RFI_24866, partial [Reticulomyxa filosa]